MTTNPLMSAEQVAAKRFTPVRFAKGYDMGEVDGFLDKVVAALQGRGDLTSTDVRACRFTPVRLREGYDRSEVDDFLGAIADTIDQIRPAAVAETPSGDCTTVCGICSATVRVADEESHRLAHMGLTP